MILDILTYLKSDATLDGLLDSSASDSKIYPSQQPQKTVQPYIIYSLTQNGTREENLHESMITFECVATSYIDVLNIRNRLVELLDKQDKIRDAVSSVDYYFYWCKNVDGDDVKEPRQDYFHKTVVFSLKYANR